MENGCGEQAQCDDQRDLDGQLEQQIHRRHLVIGLSKVDRDGHSHIHGLTVEKRRIELPLPNGVDCRKRQRAGRIVGDLGFFDESVGADHGIDRHDSCRRSLWIDWWDVADLARYANLAPHPYPTGIVSGWPAVGWQWRIALARSCGRRVRIVDDGDRLLEGSNLQRDVAAQVLPGEREILMKRLEAWQVGLEDI